jgi:hypothetical protein
MANTVSLSESFLLGLNPNQAWYNMFGCDPTDTDICNGIGSSASYALEESLYSIPTELNALDFGECFNLPIPNNKRNNSLLRRKLLSAAILDLTKERSFNGLKRTFSKSNDNGIIACIGNIRNSLSLLDGLGVASVKNIISSENPKENLSNIVLSNHESFGIEITLHSKDYIINALNTIINEHIRKVIEYTNVNEVDVLIKNNVYNFRPALYTATADDRGRFNEIVKIIRRNVDSRDKTLEEAIEKVPFKKNLLSDLYDRILLNIANELSGYGCRFKQNTFTASYKKRQHLKPLIYRIIGDFQFYLPSLINYSFVKRVNIFMPMGKYVPDIILVQSKDFYIEQFIKNYKEADFVITLPESSSLDNIFEMGDGILLDEYSVLDYKNIKNSLKDCFKDGFEL